MSVTHDCPGGCGRQIEHDKFACRADWYRLPSTVRSAITAAWRSGDAAEHMAAMVEARIFYRDHAAVDS